VPEGHLLAEEVLMEHDRLAWLIDVQPQDSIFTHEVEIDALNGHVIRTWVESPEEEEFELAAEDHQVDSQRLRRQRH